MGDYYVLLKLIILFFFRMGPKLKMILQVNLVLYGFEKINKYS